MVIKSNKTLSYDAQNPPHCLNCGAPIEPEGENYHCPYCDSLYKAEAYKYLITRFFIDKVFHDLHFLWFIFLPAIVVALLQVNGIIDEKQFETITLSYSFILAIPFTVLFFFALFKGLRDFIRHRSVPRNIRHHDPNFSQEIFTMRLNDLLAMHPEILLADEADNKKPQGIICRNLLQMYFCSYERHDGLEIVECTGMADALYLRGGSKRVRLQDKHKKFKVRLARAYGTLTPVHYQPDQFTCLNCGSHQMTEHEGTQVCSYCHTERPMETIDWVLC